MNRYNRYTRMLKTSLESEDEIKHQAEEEQVEDVEQKDDEDLTDQDDRDDEEIEEVAFVSSEDEDVIVDTSDSAEEDVARMNEAEAEVAEKDREAEEASEVVEGLEALREFVSSTRRNGGMSRQTAAAVGIAFESLRSRMNGIEAGAVLPALESFGNDSGRLRGTTMAMEGIGDLIKKAWSKFIELVKSVYRSVVNFFQRLFSATANLKARGERLLKFKVSGKPKEDSFKTKGVAKKLVVGTSVTMNPENALKILLDQLEEYKAKIKESIESLEKAAKNPLEAITGEDKVTTQTSKVLPGNVTFKVSFTKRLGGRLTMMDVEKHVAEVKVMDEVDFPVMSPANIRSSGSLAIDIAESLSGNKKLIDMLKKQQDEFANAAKNSDEYKESKGEDKQYFKDFIRESSRAVRAQSKLLTLLSAHVLNTSFIYVKLAERSAGMYEGVGKVEALPAPDNK